MIPQTNKEKEQREKEQAELVGCLAYMTIAILLVGLFLTLCGKGCSVVRAAEKTSKTYTANVSAYCLCERCCGKWAAVYPRRTASGHIVKKGDKFIAAPKNIPFGTWIYVPGYGLAQVLDRGGAIKDNRLDLYFDTHAEALKWGRKYLKVKQLNNLIK